MSNNDSREMQHVIQTLCRFETSIIITTVSEENKTTIRPFENRIATNVIF